ncbi:solute carrier family 23 member 1-like [Gigantopelta aegis]|uniref:solute carrier family 23 member 1-like n=1 Tax=Gigantopelta aegis TaxID=1735272 RepID=UPI001B88B45D|nr:solute carrier family 23 member 1-like [Gigantopelta aegis]
MTDKNVVTAGHDNAAFDIDGDVVVISSTQPTSSGNDVHGVCCGTAMVMRPEDQDTGNAEVDDEDDNPMGLEFRVQDIPPPHMLFVFGLQQVLLSISSTISIPIIVSEKICAGHLELVKSEIMSTFLFMCGVCTVLQCLIGVRLPIIQGGCHKFIPAIIALMALRPDCALPGDQSSLNVTIAEREEWQSRMREIQGGIMLASLVQVFIGCTGLLGIMLQFLGPITIVPTISLVGISLVDVALRFCEKNLWMSVLTIALVLLFALYMRNIKIPLPGCSRKKGCSVVMYPMFKLFPVVLAVAIAWGVSAILTATDSIHGKYVRTDGRTDTVYNAKWFFFPYPGQWGMPTITAASFMAMLAATITSIIESVGDYYACARISGVPPPPAHAINRGIAMEGLGSLISGAVGSGGATTSYSQNVGAIGFTKVASRSAFVTAGVIFLATGIIGKFGAVLTMMPDPVLGGIVVVSFGMVTAVGLSALSFVDLSSGRNLCIIGCSFLVGLMLPVYFKKYPDAIQTGSQDVDQVLIVLLRTSMFIGGVLAFFLDNTVPGTDEERGIIVWRHHLEAKKGAKKKNSQLYDLPLITGLLRKCRCARYVPFLPTFNFRVKSPFKALMLRFRRKTKEDENIATAQQSTQL